MRHRSLVVVALVGLSLAGVQLAGAPALGTVSATRRSAAPRADLSATLQATLVAAQRRSTAPGAAAAIYRNGTLVWQGTSGLAIRQPATPVTSSTLFSLASSSKTYTATVTLRLVELHRLSLNDTVGRWLGRQVTARARVVTIRQLLQMTSGLPDYTDAPALANAFNDANYPWRLAQLLRVVQPPHNPPGKVYEYSNTNYVLLAAIDARAGHQSFGALMKQLVLSPAGLFNTFIDRVPSAAPRFAVGYDTDGAPTLASPGARGVPTDIWGPIWGDGGVGATAADVARFEDRLYTGHLLAPSTLGTMLRPGPDGSYGMGTYSTSYDNHAFQGHDGAFGGFESDGYTDRSRGVTIVALVNADNSANTSPVDVVWDALTTAYDRTPGA